MTAATSADPFPETATELLRVRAEGAPGETATFHRNPSGDWIPTTWSALWEEVQRTAAAFCRLGLRRGDRLAIVARTCREWQVAELAGYLAGAVIVGIDAHASRDQVTWILEHADASCLLVDGTENLSKVPAARQSRLKFVLILDGEPPTAGNIRGWRELVPAETGSLSAPEWSPRPDDLATLVYTSGTTGTPKGIEYSHAQLSAACRAIIAELPDLGEPNRFVCWLPMAALFQRMINLVALAGRSVTYFVEDPREIMACIAEIRPTVFASVPRFYEKLHDGIQEKLAEQSGIRRRVIQSALNAGAEWSRCQRSGGSPGRALRARHALLDWLVLRRLRAVMGGDVKWMMTGSAAASVWLLEFFHSIGLLVLEAYGITENPVPIAANRPYAYRFGSVGKPFSMNQVRLDETREVLVKGPALFRGYHGEGLPEDRFTSDGYYRTGDYGELDENGFLYLTGRAAEIIKTSTGRRISPAAVEAVYRRSRYIDQIVIVGNNRPYLVGLIVPDVPTIQAAVSRSASQSISDVDRATSGAVVELVQRDLDQLGESLARHERVRGFVILPAPLSIESGEVTSTLKFRRERIEARHADLIESLYSEERRKLPVESPPPDQAASLTDAQR